jgi:alpha-galactosidase
VPDVPLLYKRMGQALRASGREILYSICEWGNHKPWEWARQAGGHMWRTTGDIQDSWESIHELGFQKQLGLQPYAGPGGWNDPDMLVIGMHGKGNVAAGGGTDAEYRSHFALWCLLAAPLMIGCDVRAMSDLSRTLLLNRDLIAVNQDALGAQGYRVGQVNYNHEFMDIWAKPLIDGSIAVGLFNLGVKGRQKIPVAWETLGLHDRRACMVRDLWTGENLGVYTGSFFAEVMPHDCAIITLTPQKG